MGTIIAIANQKGGVGKTTSAVNIAAALAVAERKVLLVDADPQSNATSGLGLRVENGTPTTYDCLLNAACARLAIQSGVLLSSLDVIPATPDLAGAEIELVDTAERELRLRQAIDSLRPFYDFIFIDSPPSLGLLTVNVVAAADYVIIPLQCEYYALEGLTQLLRTIQAMQNGPNTNLQVGGVILTMYDARLNLSRQVASDARSFFGGLVFQAAVPRNVRLAEAPSFGKPIILYDIASVGAQAYVQVAAELMRRFETDVSHAQLATVSYQ